MKGKVKFVNKDKSQFFSVLRERVDAYFVSNNISKNANAHMVIKTICMLGFYFVPYFLIISGNFGNWGMLGLCAAMSLGFAGIGMSVQHDANHGSYSSSSFINKMMGSTMDIIGGNVFNWKNQHNVMHHTYTNVLPYDEDINSYLILRFSPRAKLNKMQKYQYLYWWMFYGLMSFYWIVARDFVVFFEHIYKGINNTGFKKNVQQFFSLFILKSLYYVYMLVVPMYLLDITFGQWFIGFFTMHFFAGFMMSVIFQLAHVIEGSTYPVPTETGNIETDWAIHQLYNTADFARNNKVLSWFIGGLNFQIEHHLFPKICHVHYHAISEIVKKTATEFNIPYMDYDTFGSALASHIRQLKIMGTEVFVEPVKKIQEPAMAKA